MAIAVVLLGLVSAPASAFTVADPGFAVSAYASVGGAKGIAFDAAGTLRTNPDGGLAYVGDRLYAVSKSLQQVKEITGGGATVRVVTTPADLACPDGLAGWGADLFVTSCEGIYRIRGVNASPVVEYYSNPGSTPIATHAITISPDGIVFATAGDNIWRVGLASSASSFGATLTNVQRASGLAAISPPNSSGVPAWRFLFVATSDGTVRVFDQLGVVRPHAIVDGGAGGDHMQIGPDGCLYVPQTSYIARIANADGGCDLVAALGATPTITLSGGPLDPYVNATPVTLSAALTNAPSGTLVTFTVTGANPQTYTAATAPLTNRASFIYVGANVGTDTVVARATVSGTTITSGALAVEWQPPFDATAPLVEFTVAGTGAGVACPGAVSADDPLAVYCGWYATAPTVRWTYVDPESGIGLASGCDDFTLMSDSPATGTPVTCTVTNGDGVSTHRTVILQALLTAPLISAGAATSDGAPYAPGMLTPDAVTVSFACTHPAGAFAIASCEAPVTIASGDGSPVVVSGTVRDIAGKTASAAFGPIRVDTTAPFIIALGHAFGTWTNADVTVSFTCSDVGGVAACPDPVLVTATTAELTVSARDLAGNLAMLAVGPVLIDRTPPLVSATARTADGAPYVAGTPTNQTVVVTFVCATDAAPIVECPADVAVASSRSVAGTARDAAGNAASVVFGDVVIDQAAPTIVASATVGGVPYAGSWTRGPVLVAFVCADDSGIVTCPADVVVSEDGVHDVSGAAVDGAGNRSSAMVTPIRIDTTAPATTALVSGDRSADGAYVLRATIGLAAIDAGSGVTSITYWVDGAAPVTVSADAVSFVVATEGAHVVRYRATDALGNVEAERSVAFSVIFREHTTLTITSSPLVSAGSRVSARLVTASGAPVVGETVTFAAGGVLRTGTTGADGVASADLGLAPGAYTLAASYDGTPRYFPSSAGAQPVVLYAMTRFVVWAPNAVTGATVQFYGSDWSKQIAEKDARKGFGDFKGYAEEVFDASWTARPGDTVKPPKTIPEYIGVILTTGATKTGHTIRGDAVGIAIVRVGAGDHHADEHGDDHDGRGWPRPYDGRLGDRGYGVVLGLAATR